jgi:hypothetical protein
MSLSTKMNPGGGIYTNHPTNKFIMFTRGSGVGAVSRSTWYAKKRSVVDCKCKLIFTK